MCGALLIGEVRRTPIMFWVRKGCDFGGWMEVETEGDFDGEGRMG